MKSNMLIAAISQPADSHDLSFRPANGPMGLDRYISWWRWGEDDNPDSLVATVTTATAPIENSGIVSLGFRPTSLVFTRGGQLLKSHTVSSCFHCTVYFAKDNPLRPVGLEDAIRPHIINPDRQLPSNPAA